MHQYFLKGFHHVNYQAGIFYYILFVTDLFEPHYYELYDDFLNAESSRCYIYFYLIFQHI